MTEDELTAIEARAEAAWQNVIVVNGDWHNPVRGDVVADDTKRLVAEVRRLRGEMSPITLAGLLSVFQCVESELERRG